LRRSRPEIMALPAIALLALALDQLSKEWIVGQLHLGQSMSIAPWLAPIVQLTYITNTGVAFGMLQGTGDIFVIVDVVVVIALLLYYRRLPLGHVPIRIALGLQLGGALGNLTDRLLRGSVVDFIDLNFWPLRGWPIFNFSDASIVTGTVILVLFVLFEKQERLLSKENAV